MSRPYVKPSAPNSLSKEELSNWIEEHGASENELQNLASLYDVTPEAGRLAMFARIKAQFEARNDSGKKTRYIPKPPDPVRPVVVPAPPSGYVSSSGH